MKIAIPNFKVVSLIIATLFTSQVKSQAWLEEPYLSKRAPSDSAKPYTFYEIQNAFKAFEAEHTTLENGEWKKFPGYKAFKRWEYYMEPRVYPSGDMSLPATMMGKLHEEQQALLSQRNSSNGNQTQSTNGNWTALGPFNSNFDGYWGGLGRVDKLRFDPTNSNIMWACSPLGGLWKSINGGANWTVANTDFNAQIGCSDVAIDPTNSNIMYLATGDADGTGSQLSVTSQGILKSIDGGLTWQTTSVNWTNNFNRIIYKLIINPNNPQIILAATNNGIYRTTDGFTNAANVTITSGPTVYSFTDIEFNPLNPNTVYATSRLTGGANSGTIFKSTNNGVSWTQLTNGLPVPTNIRRCAIALTAQDTNKVYIVASNNSQKFYGFYVSKNGGTSFDLRANSPDILANGALGQAHYDLSIAVCPTDTSKIIVGGMLLYKSINGGFNWTLNGSDNNFGAPFVHTDHHDIQFIPGNSTAYISANDGGMSKTLNDGASWATMDVGMATSQMYRLGTSTRNQNNVMVGLQDNGNHYLSNGTWSFYSINTGDAMECVYERPLDTIIYLGSYQGRIKRQHVFGSGFGYIVNNTGAGIDGVGSWVTPHILHPTHDSTMLVGKAQVFRSTTIPHVWTQVGNVTGGAAYVIDLAYAPSNPNYIYAAKTNRIFVSTDGTNFIDRTGVLPIGSASISCITVSNTNPSLVYVGFSGYSATNKVWYSTDAGITWNPYTTGLPNVPVTSLLFHKNSSNGVYAGTDVGVYFRSDSLASWQTFKNNLPNVDVEEMEIAYSLDKIRAATNGRGLWESDLALPSANFTASTQFTCVGTPINLSDISTGGATEWLWQLPGGNITSSTVQNPSVTYAIAGTYTITLNAGNTNGTTSKTLVVTVNANPTATISASGATTFCAGNSVTLTASAGSSYVWSNGATTQTTNITTNGNYSVSVTDANGCVGNSTATAVTVNANPTATISASGATTFCAGNSVTLTASAGSSYVWSNGATTQTTNITTSGNYSVSVTDANGCVGNSTATAVTVNANPTATISASGATTFCAGNSVTLNASAASSYAWSNGATTQTTNITTSGNYSVSVTDANGCVGNSTTTAVTVNANPTATISASGATTFCAGNSVTLNASAANSYVWSNGATTQTTNITTSGNYSVSVTDANGCVGNSTTTVVTVNANPTATISANDTTTFCQGDSVLLTANSASSYLWSTNETTQGINVQTAGNYFVSLTDVNGCTGNSNTIVVTIIPFVNCLTGITTRPENLTQVVVYPNPSYDYLNISAQSLTNGEYKIILTNELGQTLVSEKVKVNSNTLYKSMNIANLADGLYFITVETENQRHISKISKIRQ